MLAAIHHLNLAQGRAVQALRAERADLRGEIALPGQTSISLPVHTSVKFSRPGGAFAWEVSVVHVSDCRVVAVTVRTSVSPWVDP